MIVALKKLVTRVGEGRKDGAGKRHYVASKRDILMVYMVLLLQEALVLVIIPKIEILREF